MADLITHHAKAGLGSVPFVPASAGGDTAEAGVTAGGWRLCGVLLLKNDHTGPHNVDVEGIPQVSVPAGEIAVIPLNGGGVAGGRLNITYSAVVALDVAAVHF